MRRRETSTRTRLHMEPEGGMEGGEGGSFVGLGSWRPDRDALTVIREAIVEDPESWTTTVGDPGFRDRFRLAGDSLKRGPMGFDRNHPLIDDIKRKDFIAVSGLGEADVVADGFVEDFADRCRAGAPFMAWLCRAVGVPF